jgi:hypothetical protein
MKASFVLVLPTAEAMTAQFLLALPTYISVTVLSVYKDKLTNALFHFIR